eukprot:3629055-Alexandrium_andersonii.AAC.1
MRSRPPQWKTVAVRAAPSYDAEACARRTITASIKPGRGDLPPEEGQPIRHAGYECGRTLKHAEGLAAHRVRAL